MYIAGSNGLSPCAGTSAFVVISVKIQFSGHGKIRYISRLISGMSQLLRT